MSSKIMISMAPVPSTPSLSSRLSTLFPHFSLSLPSTPNSKPRFQFVPLKSQPTTLTSLSLAAEPRTRRLFAASFDEFESESDGDWSEQEDSFESDPEPEEFGVQEFGKVSGYGEYGRLYVGNLPYTMTSTNLAEVFGEAGRVINVEVVYDRVTDRSRGFAFVTMGSVDEANEAIRMFDGSQVGGRTVKVNFPEVPRGGEREVMGPMIRNSNRAFVDSPHRIYAGNLGWGLTSEGLREAFSDQPGVLSAKVIYQRNSGRSRGFGFISFDSAEAAQSALDVMNGVDVDGRPLRLNIAAGRPNSTPSSYSEGNVESSADSPSSYSEGNVESSADSEELVSSISS